MARTQYPLRQFRPVQFACYLVSLGPAFGPRARRNGWSRERQTQQPADAVVRPTIKHVPASVVRDAHERIVRRGWDPLQATPLSTMVARSQAPGL